LSGLDYELGGISYFYSDDVKSLFAKKVRVNFEDLRNFSGLNIDDEKISEILTKL
jgi:phenylalanyl-tRNA synthetase beta subunit